MECSIINKHSETEIAILVFVMENILFIPYLYTLFANTAFFTILL